jgi:selenocysteine lyase/cysteine desulfurase
MIPEASDGSPHLGYMEAVLKAHSKAPLIVGSFSAGCNVTGITTDPRSTSRLLHKYGAISAWDYSHAACVSSLEATPPAGDEAAALDAIFLSPHKLAGGLGASGVLVMRREVVRKPLQACTGVPPVAIGVDGAAPPCA